MKYSIPASVSLSQLETRIADIFSMGEICKMSASEIDQRLREQIIDPINYRTPKGKRKHSVFVSGYVAGLIARHRNETWQKVEFCYLVDGVLYSTHKDSDKRKTAEFYDAGKGSVLADMPCAHFWKGSDKPYTKVDRLKGAE